MDEAAPGDRPARWLRLTAYVLAAATVALAGYAWATDALAGHIRG